MKMIKNKLIATTLLVGTILSMGSVVSANNCGDEGFEHYCGWADKEGFATHDRDKTDNTSVYVENLCMHTLGIAPRATDDGSNQACGSHAFVLVPTGKHRIRTNLYENGKRRCYLKITSASHTGVTAKGNWSPDSSNHAMQTYTAVN